MSKLSFSLSALAAACALATGARAQTVEVLPPAAQPTAPAQSTMPARITPAAGARAPGAVALPDASGATTTAGGVPAGAQPIPAQGLQRPGGDGMPPAPKLQRAGSIEYMSGGAGFEAREVIEGATRLNVDNVFSGKGGQYVVAEKVMVRGPDGTTTEIRNAGPLLSMALPPGRYTIEAMVEGRMQKKTINVAQQPVKLNWNWANAS
ncbi:MAG TPA: hypothetical protein VFR90_15535 [Methylibium sp.]|uniref:hypothetical protein n=1 Tax=Methylibium sp. TaxID=2067992 RepID=UPI002DBCBB20|nr:hypothetical protein [Methylibium sp.]HEU4460532.1 hypothetical protein [Methylibium sp.]